MFDYRSVVPVKSEYVTRVIEVILRLIVAEIILVFIEFPSAGINIYDYDMISYIYFVKAMQPYAARVSFLIHSQMGQDVKLGNHPYIADQSTK